MPPDIAALLERMAELYRELSRNKEQEITALRQALDTAELSAANERRELETLNRLSAILERENQRIAYDLEEDRRGKMAAGNLRSADEAGGGEAATDQAANDSEAE